MVGFCKIKLWEGKVSLFIMTTYQLNRGMASCDPIVLVFSQTLRLRLWLNSVGSTSRFCLYYECGKLCLSLTKGKQIFGYSFVLCVVVAYLYGLNFSILDACNYPYTTFPHLLFSLHGLPYIVRATNSYFLKYTTNNGITPNKAALLLRYACR